MNTEVKVDAEMVERLLHGSRNLDRMKADIRSLVESLIGLVWLTKSKSLWLTCTLRFECGFIFINECDNELSWRVQGFKLEGERVGIEIECVLSKEGSEVKIYSSRNSKINMGCHLIQPVYESLPVLVNGLITGFPGIREKMEILFRASMVKFPS